MDPFSIVSGLLGGLGSLGSLVLSAKQYKESDAKSAADMQRQYEYQSKLNAEQQAYAEKNATIQYDRLRELMSDSAVLQKQGLRAAGMSTAGLDKTSSAPAVSMPEAAPAGSAPSASSAGANRNAALSNLTSSLRDASTIGVDILMQKRQADLIKSQQAAQDINNLTLGAKNEAEIWKLVESGKLDKAKAEEILFDLGISKETRSSKIESIVQEAIGKRLENILTTEKTNTERLYQGLLTAQKDYTVEQKNKLLKELQWYDKEMQTKLQNIVADTWLKKYSWDKVSQEANYLSELADKINIEKQLDEAKLPFASDTARLIKEQMQSNLALLGQKIQIAIEEAKAKGFENEHQMANFVKNQITSYLNSFANVLGGVGSILGGSYSGAPSDGGIVIPEAKAPEWTTTPAVKPYI